MTYTHGHHESVCGRTSQSLREINDDIFSYDEGWYFFTMVVMTPTFMGAEPAER